MAAVTIAGMRALESAAMAGGWSEEDLMDLAGKRLGHAISRFFPVPGTAIGYLGKGHNAADTLIALRVMRDEFGWDVMIRHAFEEGDRATLTNSKLRQLVDVPAPAAPPDWRDLTGPIVLLDGLLGIGARGSLRGPLLPLAAEMESLRQHAGARVAAVDLPSGVNADTGEILPGSVIADVTFMIGAAKIGLLKGACCNATGALVLVPVEPLASGGAGDVELISPQSMDFGKYPRPFDFHKGMAGRVAVLAGSAEYTGAAILAASGALGGGAGLITLHVPAGISALVTTRCPPEIIVRGYENPLEVLETKFDALVAGCGLGDPDVRTCQRILELIARCPVPAIIDADALNLLARLNSLSLLTESHVVTPHPGEFRRLAPDLAALPREEAARRFSDRFPATLLLKGARTLVTRQGQPLFFNATGTPAMASGGQGDLLAGVIGARLALGELPLHAAALAAWICGRAAERACHARDISEESLTASEVFSRLGGAFRDWRESGR